MDLRRWTGVRFTRWAPTRDGGKLGLRVAPMAASHVAWWHSRVQPFIDADPGRVDNGWNWMLYAPFTRLYGLVLARRPVGYSVGIVDDTARRFLPMGLTLLLGRDRALDNHARKSTFAWYLTTAPDAALLGIADYGLTEARLPRRLGTIVLDVAVTHSLNHRARGRVSLHADPKGGDALLGWYEKRGMTALPKDRKLPVGPRRLFAPSDGRYCYYTVPAAVAASHDLDDLR
jgi:hypothetical protein